MIKNYLKTVWRNLFRNRTTSAINLFGLSVGMTAAVLIFLWVNNEMSFDGYHPGADNIYRVTNTLHVTKGQDWVWESSPYLLADEVQKKVPGISKTAKCISAYWSNMNFKIHNEIFGEKNIAYVDRNWFNMFHYDLIEGSIKPFNENPFSLVLTESKAKKYFGNNSAVGQEIRIDTISYTVQAVVKDNPVNSSFQFDVLMPVDAYLADPAQRKNDMNWSNFNYLTFLQLSPGIKKTDIEKKIETIYSDSKRDNNITANLVALKEMHFETNLQTSSIKHTNKKTVYVFSILGLLLLVTACVNYVNLTTARASLRVKEISVRKIMGAQRRQLFGQFMAESLMMSLLSLGISLILIWILLPLYDQLTGKHFVLSWNDKGMWTTLGTTLLATTLLNGVYPAMLLSSFGVLNIFRGMNVLKIRDTGLRKGLVVFQFCLSVLLIISTIVISRQLHFIQHTDPGYDREQIIALQIPYKAVSKLKKDERTNFTVILKDALSKQPGIIGVTSANGSIVEMKSTTSGSSNDWDGRDTSFRPTLGQLSVDENYQKIFKIQLAQGRWFRPDLSDKHNYILNETAVEELGIHKPVIGQRFTFHGDTGQIIGVTKDFHYLSMHEKIGPLVLFGNSNWQSAIFIKAAAGNSKNALLSAEKTWKAALPGIPFDYTFLDDSFNNLYKSDLKISSLILIFSIIVVIISSLGLFGLAAFTAERRIKEIGIRKVLGATVFQIASLLSTEFVWLVCIAILIASPLAWWAMNKWLQDFAYHIDISWWMFMVAALFALMIALATVSFQAIKAALANPVNSLRTE